MHTNHKAGWSRRAIRAEMASEIYTKRQMIRGISEMAGRSGSRKKHNVCPLCSTTYSNDFDECPFCHGWQPTTQR